MSINFENGVWWCFAGRGGGSISRLIDARDTWIPLDGRVWLP